MRKANREYKGCKKFDPPKDKIFILNEAQNRKMKCIF